MRRLACAGAAALAIFTMPAPAEAACPAADLRPQTAADVRAYERAVLCLVDTERARRDRARLGTDARLARAAERHAEDMVERSYFAHDTPGGLSPLDRIRRAGYRGTRLGEVLAWGTRSRSTARATVDAWLRSRGHRAALLDPAYDEAGAGATRGTPADAGAPGITVAVTLGGRGG